MSGAPARRRDLHDEAGRPAVAACHLLKQDGVDAQPSGGVGGLAQQPRRQPDKRMSTHVQKCAVLCLPDGFWATVTAQFGHQNIKLP